MNLPLSADCRAAIQFAAGESEALGRKDLGPEHLLLGLLRRPQTFAAQLLHALGVGLVKARKKSRAAVDILSL